MSLQLVLLPLAHAGPHRHDVLVPPGPANLHELLRTWAVEPGVVIPLALSGCLYLLGLSRMWRGGGIGRGIKTWEAWCFAGGWITLVVALVSPLHPWGQVLFSAHMTQHELLMLIAAPLLVLGRPVEVWLKALPAAWSHALARASNNAAWLSVWRSISNPLAAWLIHAAALWIWHIPSLMEAVLHNEFVHAMQHVAFLFSALLFWWALIHGRQSALNYGVAVLYMFTTALHSGLLGVLITFAARVWYPSYAHTTQSWGVTPLEDQQLGGLIMWIPAGVVYIVAGLALMAGWMRESEARVLRHESSDRPAATLAVPRS